MDVYLKSGTLAHKLYDLDKTEENYYCNFGINPAFKQYLAHPQIVFLVLIRTRNSNYRITKSSILSDFAVCTTDQISTGVPTSTDQRFCKSGLLKMINMEKNRVKSAHDSYFQI